MYTIYKYPLEALESQKMPELGVVLSATLPRNARILEMAFQNDILCVWASVVQDEPGYNEHYAHHWLMMPTGVSMSMKAARYARYEKTLHQPEKGLVWHIHHIYYDKLIDPLTE